MGSDKDSLISEGKGKKKKTITSDVKKIIHHLPHVGQCLASLQAMSTSPKKPSSLFLLLSVILYRLDYPFDQFRSGILAVPHPIS